MYLGAYHLITVVPACLLITCLYKSYVPPLTHPHFCFTAVESKGFLSVGLVMELIGDSEIKSRSLLDMMKKKIPLTNQELTDISLKVGNCMHVSYICYTNTDWWQVKKEFYMTNKRIHIAQTTHLYLFYYS